MEEQLWGLGFGENRSWSKETRCGYEKLGLKIWSEEPL